MLKSEWFWTAVVTLLFFGLSLGGGYYLGSHVSLSGFTIFFLLSITIVMFTSHNLHDAFASFIVSFFLCFLISLLVGFMLYSWRLLFNF